MEAGLSECLLYDIDLKIMQIFYTLKIFKQNKNYWDSGLNIEELFSIFLKYSNLNIPSEIYLKEN